MRSNYSTGYGNIANQRSRDFNDTMIATEDKFEEMYISLRKKEGRCYTDKELVELPDISASHLHYKEWQVRRRSCRRLIEYLSDMNKPLNILEVGCGNGWLSHRLSGIHGSRVFATDVCSTEINQAARIFKEIKNLKFIQGNWKHVRLDQSEFDIIIFAASVQYFSSLTDLGTEAK